MSLQAEPRDKTTVKTIFGDDPRHVALVDYIHEHAQSPHPYLSNIRAHCMSHKWNFMLTTPDQAAFLFAQTKILNAKRILEIGCFYGHSTLAMAAGLCDEGRLISIEHNPKFVAIAKDHMEKAGVARKIDFMVGEATHCLDALTQEQTRSTLGKFDLIFIDADKKNVTRYWTTAFEMIRTGGLIIIDNALARGEIINTSIDTPAYVVAMREFNNTQRQRTDCFSFIAPIGDGMHITVKI